MELEKLRNNFIVFILCYNRPDQCDTYDTLKRYGYKGNYMLMLSDDDPSITEYINKYGRDKIYVFNKDNVKFDRMDNFGKKKSVVFARNACFEAAKELGFRYFLELDDDYVNFRFRYDDGTGKLCTAYPDSLEPLFEIMLQFLDSSSHIKSVALAQTGDYIGGTESGLNKGTSIRKAMNTFFCDTEKPFTFSGCINEDVNTYTALQSRGCVFLTEKLFSIDQRNTQQSHGGMVDIYADVGTYVKSFYTIIAQPSSVKIAMMGDKHYRIHHKINWNNTAVKIVSCRYKKGDN